MNNNNNNLNAKRSLSDLDPDNPEDLGLLSQSSKRVADQSTMPKNDNNQPPNSTNSLNNQQGGDNDPIQDNMDNQHFSNSLKNLYTIQTDNQFDVLNNVNKKNVSNSTKITKPPTKQKLEKVPPITIVGATNFTTAIKILNDSAPKIEYTIKYMSIGTKIMLKSSESHSKLKSLLKAANVEFFSHDLNSEKYDKFILSGIARTSKEEIEDSLKIYQVEPIEIREIDQKNKRFNDEGSYIVSFKRNSTNINNLNNIKINYTVPKWRIFRSSKNNITQCKRCQLHGHGIRNCNMLPKCAKCGLDHLSDNCNSPVEKCANCKGDHSAVSTECPKRKDFLEMRNRLASSHNKTSRKPTPAPRKSIANFPNLMKSSPTITDANSPNSINWSSLFKNNSTTPSQIAVNKNNPNNLFKTEEIGPIMIELLSGLRICQNKEQQFIVMFEIATKYIYNVEP